MVAFNELRACKSCGIVFSIWGGSLKISSCPQCKGKNFDTIDADKELEQE